MCVHLETCNIYFWVESSVNKQIRLHTPCCSKDSRLKVEINTFKVQKEMDMNYFNSASVLQQRHFKKPICSTLWYFNRVFSQLHNVTNVGDIWHFVFQFNLYFLGLVLTYQSFSYKLWRSSSIFNQTYGCHKRYNKGNKRKEVKRQLCVFGNLAETRMWSVWCW